MSTHTKQFGTPSREWLRKRGEAEDRAASVSVGGLAHDLGVLRYPAATESLLVFAKFVELARRYRRLSVENLAKEADVELAELVAIERDFAVPEPRTVYKLADTLRVPVRRLMMLAGLSEGRDEALAEAAVRFAARSEPTARLSKEEKAAFEEFAKVLAEATDGG